MSAPRPATRKLLSSIQRQLAAIYRIDTSARVADYLLDEGGRARLAALDGAPAGEGELLVLEEAGDVWLGVYLDPTVQERLAARDPFERLDRDNLDPFLTAVEETSHFLYLVWSLAHERTVTRLELEVQGEVDKFVSGALVIAGQRRGAGAALDGEALSRILFEEWTLRAGLDAEDASRYRVANRLASGYCRSLQARYLERAGAERIDRLLAELRSFYRRRGGAKMHGLSRN